jgi:hypothetical protein
MERSWDFELSATVSDHRNAHIYICIFEGEEERNRKTFSYAYASFRTVERISDMLVDQIL